LKNTSAHKVLLFTSDQLSKGRGLARAMGSRFAPGAFCFWPDFAGLDSESYTGR